jgi:hypothetical protein
MAPARRITQLSPKPRSEWASFGSDFATVRRLLARSRLLPPDPPAKARYRSAYERRRDEKALEAQPLHEITGHAGNQAAGRAQIDVRSANWLAASRVVVSDDM